MLKEDRLVTTTFQLTEFVQKHTKQIFIGGAVLITLLGVVFFIFQSKSSANRKAAELYGQGIIELKTGNPQMAAFNFRTVVDRYAGSEWAPMACFQLANAAFNLKDYTQASNYYKQYVDKYVKMDTLLTASAWAGMGSCQEALHNHNAAGDFYFKAAALVPGSFMAPQYLLSAGRAYTSAKNKIKALECYQKIFDQYPLFTQINIARKEQAQAANL
ncbi:MAG: hypothetical protein A2V73_00455 [candidate division Zixibacteria bacterium RBG_19FT_COMBO_42_43]|nr:MAG: hypothetical protein A2V73_00455 [candidate division Zixibacteria bacterium RBG_19FT_COMBO_42_43]